jgi:mRNA-degrading endonuclease RelE of RelBE toxin-antitoxin system
MSFNIIPTQKFKKEAKRLSRKYPSLKEELTSLNDLLATQPHAGTSLGNSLYKIRISVKSKGRGKSGGSRVITYVIDSNREVYLLTIYDKAELTSVDDKTLRTIVKSLTS